MKNTFNTIDGQTVTVINRGDFIEFKIGSITLIATNVFGFEEKETIELEHYSYQSGSIKATKKEIEKLNSFVWKLPVVECENSN